jgi:hypothetical protein
MYFYNNNKLAMSDAMQTHRQETCPMGELFIRVCSQLKCALILVEQIAIIMLACSIGKHSYISFLKLVIWSERSKIEVSRHTVENPFLSEFLSVLKNTAK